jgi:Tfp pilus assembly protein PilF
MARKSKKVPSSLKKLAEITDIPLPSAEEVAKAKAKGAVIVGASPTRARQLMVGQITLGDFAGISKKAQHQMAQVGYTYLNQGKTEPAKQVFEGLVALDPYDAYFHMALASVHQRAGALKDAEESYTRSLEFNKHSPAAYANRGEVRLFLGKIAEAAQDLAKAIELDPQAKQDSTKRAHALAEAVRQQLAKASKS